MSGSEPALRLKNFGEDTVRASGLVPGSSIVVSREGRQGPPRSPRRCGRQSSPSCPRSGSLSEKVAQASWSLVNWHELFASLRNGCCAAGSAFRHAPGMPRLHSWRSLREIAASGAATRREDGRGIENGTHAANRHPSECWDLNVLQLRQNVGRKGARS